MPALGLDFRLLENASRLMLETIWNRTFLQKRRKMKRRSVNPKLRNLNRDYRLYYVSSGGRQCGRWDLTSARRIGDFGSDTESDFSMIRICDTDVITEIGERNFFAFFSNQSDQYTRNLESEKYHVCLVSDSLRGLSGWRGNLLFRACLAACAFLGSHSVKETSYFRRLFILGLLWFTWILNLEKLLYRCSATSRP